MAMCFFHCFFLRSTSAVIVLKVEHPYTIFALADSIIWFFQGQLSAWPGLIRIPWWQPASVLSVPVVQKTLRICQSTKCAHIAEGVAGWRCKVVPLDTWLVYRYFKRIVLYDIRSRTSYYDSLNESSMTHDTLKGHKNSSIWQCQNRSLQTLCPQTIQIHRG